MSDPLAPATYDLVEGIADGKVAVSVGNWRWDLFPDVNRDLICGNTYLRSAWPEAEQKFPSEAPVPYVATRLTTGPLSATFSALDLTGGQNSAIADISPTGLVLCINRNGKILTGSDFGQTWNPVNPDLTDGTTAFTAIGESHSYRPRGLVWHKDAWFLLLTSVSRAHLLRSVDGRTWTSVSTAAENRIKALSGTIWSTAYVHTFLHATETDLILTTSPTGLNTTPAFSYSSDLGDTWSTIVPSMTLPEPPVKSHNIRLCATSIPYFDGDFVAFAFNDAWVEGTAAGSGYALAPGNSRVSIRYSYDRGQTWETKDAPLPFCTLANRYVPMLGVSNLVKLGNRLVWACVVGYGAWQESSQALGQVNTFDLTTKEVTAQAGPSGPSTPYHPNLARQSYPSIDCSHLYVVGGRIFGGPGGKFQVVFSPLSMSKDGLSPGNVNGEFRGGNQADSNALAWYNPTPGNPTIVTQAGVRDGAGPGQVVSWTSVLGHYIPVRVYNNKVYHLMTQYAGIEALAVGCHDLMTDALSFVTPNQMPSGQNPPYMYGQNQRVSTGEYFRYCYRAR